ncbi:MAG: cytochrome b/b6 domain-containing protein [Parasphingorhabdus sp.]|uniref:cytochrome b/b6 domain-containing protein n=1 Tax=Parasphingorhabdus sp. TaxID=2709688 RepID=UPI0030033161
MKDDNPLVDQVPTGQVGKTFVRSQRIKVWDPLVRIFHWTVALGTIANLTVLRHVEDPHIYLGYAMVAALLVRLIWGFVGKGHARFSAFVPGPKKLLGYGAALMARREPRYIGHNPAGAIMMLVLMALVAGLGITGWMMGSDQFWGEPWVEELHETLANIIIGAAVLHVGAAIVESVRQRENMPWSMITGYKRAASGSDIDDAPASR